VIEGVSELILLRERSRASVLPAGFFLQRQKRALERVSLTDAYCSGDVHATASVAVDIAMI
jgi:hypothetical protein